MTDDRSLERAARSWLEEGPTRAPDRPVEAALARIQSTKQQRDLWVPWRLPTMNPVMRLATIAIVAAAAVGGAIYFLRSASNVGSPVQTSPAPSPQQTAQGTTLAEYKAARDAICGPAIAQVIALNDQAANLQPDTKPADVTPFADNLAQIIGVGSPMVDALARLTPPPGIAAEHAADVTHHRDSLALLQQAVTELRSGNVAHALAIADATNVMSGMEEAYEQRYGLAGCP
jgi:hypothetical protein